nr:hypothetical protein [Haloferax sp. BAB-2207]
MKKHDIEKRVDELEESDEKELSMAQAIKDALCGDADDVEPPEEPPDVSEIFGK